MNAAAGRCWTPKRCAAELEEERLWLERAKAHPEAFRWLYDRYSASIVSLLRGLVRNRHDADDLAARVFFRALLGLGRFRWQGRPYGAYLHRIAMNEAVSYWRTKRRRRFVDVDAFAAVAEFGRDRLSELISAEEERRLRLAIAEMKEADRVVLAMYYWEDLNTAEIAAHLDQPQGSVQARLKRARDKLQLVLAEVRQRTAQSSGASTGANPRNLLGMAVQRRLRTERDPG